MSKGGAWYEETHNGFARRDRPRDFEQGRERVATGAAADVAALAPADDAVTPSTAPAAATTSTAAAVGGGGIAIVGTVTAAD